MGSAQLSRSSWNRTATRIVRVMARVTPHIDRILVSTYTVPTDQPEADGTATWNATTAVVAQVESNGVSGLGWSYTTPAAAEVIEGLLTPVVVGQSAFDLPGIAERMARACRNAGRTGLVSCAISAVDIALWDLTARLLDVALVDLLGRAHESVDVYGSGGFTTYDDERTVQQLRHWTREQGISRVKIKIGESAGHNVTRDLHRVALAREAIGPGCELFVDANGGYTVGQAGRVEQDMRQWDVRWFEEPVSSDYPDQLAAVRANSRADIAAGEYIYRLSDARTLVTAGAVDCLQLDVTRCGGITPWRSIAGLAESFGLDLSAHCAPALSAHIAAATVSARHLEYFHDHVRLERMLFDGVLDVVDGTLTPDSSRVGHGMSLRDDAENYRV